MSDINWDDAPEDSTHWDSSSCVFCNVKGYWREGDYISFDDQWGWGSERYIAKPVTLSPIYTQELEDNGSIVESGMLFATEAGEYTAEYTNKKSIVFTDEDGFLISINRRYAKPITPPKTDTEKAISDFHCYGFGDGLTAKASILALDLIKAGKVHGVTFTGES